MYDHDEPHYHAKVWHNLKISLLITVVLVLISPACNAQKTFVEDGKLNGVLPLNESGAVTYVRVADVAGVSKEELYKRARKWFVKTYASPKDVLQLSDKETGELTGKGILDIPVQILRVRLGVLAGHTVTVELKDERYRITVNAITINSEPLLTYKLPFLAPPQKQYTTLYTTIDERVKALITSLQTALFTTDDF